jgi:hypothetical protein
MSLVFCCLAARVMPCYIEPDGNRRLVFCDTHYPRECKCGVCEECRGGKPNPRAGKAGNEA